MKCHHLKKAFSGFQRRNLMPLRFWNSLVSKITLTPPPKRCKVTKQKREPLGRELSLLMAFLNWILRRFLNKLAAGKEVLPTAASSEA